MKGMRKQGVLTLSSPADPGLRGFCLQVDEGELAELVGVVAVDGCQVTGYERRMIGMLRLSRRWSCHGTPYFVVTEDEPQDLASVALTIVAATLAEPLRKAFDRHMDQHGCGEPGNPEYAGFLRCPEALALWKLLPEGDTIAYG